MIAYYLPVSQAQPQGWHPAWPWSWLGRWDGSWLGRWDGSQLPEPALTSLGSLCCSRPQGATGLCCTLTYFALFHKNSAKILSWPTVCLWGQKLKMPWRHAERNGQPTEVSLHIYNIQRVHQRCRRRQEYQWEPCRLLWLQLYSSNTQSSVLTIFILQMHKDLQSKSVCISNTYSIIYTKRMCIFFKKEIC